MFRFVDKRIYVYGYTPQFSRMQSIERSLESVGKRVEGIIDRNANDYGEHQIVRMDDFLSVVGTDDKDNYCIILNFHDANMHTFVADELANMGFSNIIFLPFEAKFLVKESRILRKFYNRVLYGGIIPCNLPTYHELLADSGESVICDYDGNVSFWCDIKDIYCETYTVKRISDYDYTQFDGKHLSEFTYYIELYEYCFGGSQFPTGYINNSLKGREIEPFIHNRICLFHKMKEYMLYDGTYFEDAPILVHWDYRFDHLSVLDGYHRAIFLYMNGYERIPVILDKLDYQRYIHGKK